MKNRNSIAVLFFSFWVVASCAFNIPPTKDEYLAIKEGQKSLVLLRVTGEMTDESAIDTFSSFAADENFNIAVGDFETAGALKRIENQKSGHTKFPERFVFESFPKAIDNSFQTTSNIFCI